MRRLDALVLTHAEADHEGDGARRSSGAPPAARARRRRGLADGGAARRCRAAAGGRARRRRARRAGARARRRPPAAAVAAAARRPAGAADGDPNDRAVVALAQRRPVRPAADRRRGVRRHGAARRCRDVEALKVAHHGSDDPGLPALLARIRPQRRGDRGRAPQHLRAPDAVDARRAPRRCRRWCARTATARCACTSRPERGRAVTGRAPTSAASRLGRRARLQARLPRPRRRPRPHRRAPRASCARWRRRRAASAASRCSRATSARADAVIGALTTMSFAIGPALRDRRRRGALEGRRRRGGRRRDGRHGRRDADARAVRPRGGRATRSPTALRKAVEAAGGVDRRGGRGQAVASSRLGAGAGARARPRARRRGRQGARRPGRRPPAAAAARAREARARARAGRRDRRRRRSRRRARPRRSARRGRSRTRWSRATSRARCARSSSCAGRASGCPGCSTRSSAGSGTRSRSPRRSRPASRPRRRAGRCACRRRPPSGSWPTSRKRDVEAFRRALEVMADLELESRGGGASGGALSEETQAVTRPLAASPARGSARRTAGG